ncbi:Frigida-like [Macleaya cordata]|uniref:FRIGIDA-like protein n=1 Tax=Macleaya cordata TaxID=56857 RepID=A0A200PS27_MACCD|nr:Frigida-like [Macleaya cordata]
MLRCLWTCIITLGHLLKNLLQSQFHLHIAMTDAEPVASGVESASIFEQLGKAFIELEAHSGASENKVQWKEIEEYFQNLGKSLKKGFSDLEEKEKAFVEKESETRALVAEREAVVAAKEQALVDRVQELKDTAVAAILEAWEKRKPASPELVDVASNTDIKVSSSFNGDPSSPNSAPEENSPYRSGEHAVAVDVQPRPELTQFCEQMDAKGLLNFIMENRKNIVAIREEIPVALKSATKPAKLVLDSLEGFYPPPDETTTHQGNKRDASLQGMRRSCVMLMECVAPLLVGSESDADDPLNPETKQQAKAIADEWKPRLAEADIDAANGNSLEAEAFLQLLATFRIASEFDEEELCKLVLAVARRRQAPELCRSLGLTHKMPGVVETLISSGRQIDAVHFVQAFKLTENFPPVPLLKTYLKDLRRNSQGKIGSSGGAVGVQNDANAQELAALKAVIRCVDEYKLEAEYPLDPLQKRVAQLEKSKADKKRMGEVVKHHQPKRPRANGGGHYGSRMPISAVDLQQPPPVYGERGAYMGAAAERYHPHTGGVSTFDYHQMPNQGGAYGQQQAIAQRPPYYYSQDERATTASYNATAQSNYGGYIANGVQPSHQSYM